jgi:guanine deaminase
MTDHQKYLEMAVEMAVKSVHGKQGGPFGAIVVRDGQIIGRGMNSVTRQHDPTAHAEVLAIRDACRYLGHHQLDDCIIYSSCEPCPMCMGAIYWARPKAVYFASTRDDAAAAGFDDSFIYDELAKPYDRRAIGTIRLDIQDRSRPFEIWLESQDREDY